MFIFESQESFQIAGRGNAYAVHNPVECDNFDHLIDKMVQINSNYYKVIGVERFAHTPPWRKGEDICLLVDDNVKQDVP